MYYTYRGNKAVKPAKPVVKHAPVGTLAGALGVVLKQLRTQKGLTVRELSERSFVSPGHISEVERGLKEISSSGLASLAKALDTPLSAIVREASFLIAFSEIRDAELASVSEPVRVPSIHAGNGV